MTGPRRITIDLRPSDAARLDLMAERTGLSVDRLAADLFQDILASAIPSEVSRDECGGPRSGPAGRGTNSPARALSFIAGVGSQR